jgi:hypothetical protein
MAVRLGKDGRAKLKADMELVGSRRSIQPAWVCIFGKVLTDKSNMHKILLAIVALFCLVDTAQAVELPSATVTPVVLSETRTMVWSAYSHNPDCSVNEVPVVRVIKRPANGEVEIEEGSGYSHYPKDSQLYECNKQQTLMSNTFYTSKKGFKGSDSFEVEVFFTAGNSRKVRFRVTIK